MQNLNQTVFTTSNVVEEKNEILLVFHDLDDNWQFFSKNDSNKNESAMLLSLGEIIQLDKTITELSHIEMGFKAHRNCKDSPWIIEKDID